MNISTLKIAFKYLFGGVSGVVEYLLGVLNAALGIKIEDAQGEYYIAAGARQTDGTFRVYLAPGYFPAVSDSLKYHVYVTDQLDEPMNKED